MASGDPSSSVLDESVKDAKAHAQGTPEPSRGGPDEIFRPSTTAPTPSWARSGVLTLDDSDASFHQASSSSSRRLQRSPGTLDLTRRAGSGPEKVAKPPAKRKLFKSFPEYGTAKEGVGDVLPIDVAGPQVGGVATKKTVASKHSRKYHHLMRALERLHIADGGELERAKTGASSKMEQDGTEGSSDGSMRTMASEEGKASRKRSKGRKREAGRASSSGAVVSHAQKGKEGKKSGGLDGKQRQIEDGGEEKNPKKNLPKTAKKPRSVASSCSPAGVKSKRPRRGTTSDPGSPSVVKPTAYVHLR